MDKKTLQELLSKAQEYGVSLSEKTTSALNELENPHYTITLSGEFQVGKSTLLNKVMLGSDVLLTEGVGLPTTAIPCKVIYAPTKELTVVYRDDQKSPLRYFGDTITGDLLRSLTTAMTEDARLELSKEIRYVQLGLPVEAIRNYTFFDTPGVNDPNVELIERTTVETLPESDIVLLVVDASKALTSHSMSYLRKAVFSAGMSRVMVLASYKPQVYMRAEDRQMVLDNIRAQLSSIGRGYVPVVSYTYDPGVEGDILRGPNEIMDAILRYISENKEIAKIDKLAYQLSSDVVAYIESLKASVEVSGKGEAEIAELKSKIEAVARNLDAQYNQSLNDFASEYACLHQKMDGRLRAELFDEDKADSAQNLFMKQFEGGLDSSQIRERIQSAVQTVAPLIQAKLIEVSSEFRDSLNEILLRVSDKAVSTASALSISTEFNPTVSGGWIGKLNPKLVKALEVGGAVLFAGPLYGVIVYFLDRVPIISRFLPHGMLAAVMLKTLKQSFCDSLTTTYQGMLGQMNNSVDSIRAGIKDLYADIYAEKIAPYKEAINVGQGNILDGDKLAKTRALIKSLDDFVVQLSK